MATVAEPGNAPRRPEDIMHELHRFVSGAANQSKVSSDSVAQSALFLLRTLPATRHAVLEHLSNLFTEAVNCHILMVELEHDMADSDDAHDSTIADIQNALMSFVKNNPSAWAPIISAWSIELLGQVSSKYSERRGVPHPSNLNELLQLWMTCQPTKVLIDVASQCFAAMVGDAPDICVDALLEASVKHSPHFDWVVAHIGSCFPTTIITRVLMCGLKEFSRHGAAGPDGSVATDHKVPKMASVVGILGHLASRHGNDIRKALLVLFKDSLKPNPGEIERRVVPFLLHLASMSQMLLQVIATDFVTAVTPATLNQLAQQFTGTKGSLPDANNLINLTVHLVTKCQTGTYRVLQFVMDVAAPLPRAEDAMETNEEVMPVVQETAAKIMDKLVADLDRMSQVWMGGPGQIPCLVALRENIGQMCQDICKATGKRQEWLSMLIRCVAIQSAPTVAADILCNLLKADTSTEMLQRFISICCTVESKYFDVVAMTTDLLMHSLYSLPSHQQVCVLKNLKYLLEWQRLEPPQNSMHNLLPCLLPHLQLIAGQLSHDETIATVAMELLVAIGNPPHQYLGSLPVLMSATNALFFRAFHLKDAGKKVQLCTVCTRYLQQLVHCPFAMRPVLRLILEATLSQEHALTMGAKLPTVSSSSDDEKKFQQPLQDGNKKHAMSVIVPRMHSTVFHAGVIGQGLKPLPQPSPFTKDEQMQNKQLLLELLWSCSVQLNNGQSDVSLDGSEVIPPATGRHLALLLIELVAPDVMYNGLPWPEEDFMKVTVERDLQIRNMFDVNPMLWDLLDLVATSPGALCFCSSLLRGVCATLLSFWESCREKKACNAPKALETSCCLIKCMRKGVLLPGPLGYIDELFGHLTPYEVYLLLGGIWKFMKEKPPIPDPRENALRVIEARHVKIIRNILHNNIALLGHKYSRLFPTT